jgi:hypothetical protein
MRPRTLLSLLFLLCAWFSAWAARLALTGEIGHDDIEHLHTAWLIDQGYLPFVDFFQKQSPLFWQMLRPALAAGRGELPATLLAARGLMLAFLALTTLAVWLLARQAATAPSSRRAPGAPSPGGEADGAGLAWVAAFLVLASPVLVHNLAAVRPDGPMIAALLWGTLLVVRFFRTGRRLSLVAGGFLLGLASALLLKAVPYALVVGLLAVAAEAEGNRGRELPGRGARLLLLAAGGLAAGLPFLGWLAWCGLLDGFLFFNVTFNGHLYVTSSLADVPWGLRVQQVLTTEATVQPWLLVSLLAGLAACLHARRKRRGIGRTPTGIAQATVVGLAGAGIGLILANRLPFTNYFLVPLLCGALLAPGAVQWVAEGLGSWRLALARGDASFLALPLPRLLGGLALAGIVAVASVEYEAFPTSEGQLEKIAALRSGEGSYKLPWHPVFVPDRRRIWDNVERYVETFRQLEARGEVPEWVQATYGPEYRPPPP